MGLLRYLKEWLKGYHRHTCGRCKCSVHPWEDRCQRCGAEINWHVVYSEEQLRQIRAEHRE